MISQHNAQHGESSPPSVLSPLADRACTILHEWVESESLRRHCYAVADSLRAFRARQAAEIRTSGKRLGSCTTWITSATRISNAASTDGHPFVAATWLREHGWSEEVCRAVLSHADYAGVARVTPLEQTLYAVDELSGFVMAVARVRPSKSIQEVDVAAVKKKMKDKAFARAVNREDIICGAAKLGRPLEEVIAGVITALQADAERLGLGGSR